MSCWGLVATGGVLDESMRSIYLVCSHLVEEVGETIDGELGRNRPITTMHFMRAWGKVEMGDPGFDTITCNLFLMSQ